MGCMRLNQLSFHFSFINFEWPYTKTQTREQGTGEICIDGWNWSCLAAAFWLGGCKVSGGNIHYSPFPAQTFVSRLFCGVGLNSK